ncbi:putative signal transducing protein [Zobellia nedashkovskayae]
MKSNEVKIYSGNRFTAQRIQEKLNEVGISPIIKDASESARLAGFAANINGELDIHVRNDEEEKAMIIVRAIAAQQKD